MTKQEPKPTPQGGENKIISILKSPIFLWLSALFALGGAIGMRTIGSDFFTSFVQVPQAAVPLLNQWIIDACSASFNPTVRPFFISDIFFAIGLFGLHLAFFYRLRREYNITWQVLAIIVFTLALVLDLLEGYSFFQEFQYDNASFKGRTLFIQNFKRLAYAASWTILIYLLISQMYQFMAENTLNIKVFFQDYFRYFYPSIISILGVAVLFSVMEQFDTVILMLTSGANLFIFSILYLISIIVVWFIPYYLFFTDAFYNKVEKADIQPYNSYMETKAGSAELVSYQGVYRLLKSIIPDEYYELIRKRVKEQTYKHYEANQSFHHVRAILGLLFIVILFNLQVNVYIILCEKVWLPTSLATLLFTIFLAALYLWSMRRVRTHFKFFRIVLIACGLLFLTLLALTFFEQENTRLTALYFTMTTVFAGMGYVFLLHYLISSFLDPSNRKKEKNDKTLAFGRWIPPNIYDRFTLVFMILCILPIPFLLFVGIYCLGGGFYNIHWLNSANFYLLFINGGICLFAFIDRLIKIYKKRGTLEIKTEVGFMKTFRENINKHSRKLYVIGITALVVLGIHMFRTENYHHEVRFVAEENKTVLPTLKEFTADFLQRPAVRNNSTIYLIAAEGGGLRGAYWTMSVLDSIARSNKPIYGRTFLQSGISGGGIGLGMYTYMQSVGDKNYNESISNRINTIGHRNFLTGDIAGLFTRALVSAVLRFESLKNYDDRHRMMSNSYFNIAGAPESLTKNPYYNLWTNAANKPIPLLFVNATRTEDGARAVVHPLRDGGTILEPFIDITKNHGGEYISYPDAVFLTNRFPGASPAARIESKGNFVDGGYYENSGLETILHTLQYMKAQIPLDQDSVYYQFFQKKIVLLNIQNSSGSFILNELLDEENLGAKDVNRIFKQGQVGSIISAAANSGMTGHSNYYNQLLKEKSIAAQFGLDAYHTFNLPHLINKEDPHKLLKGQIISDQCSLNEAVEGVNGKIKSTRGYVNAIKPPLGRVMHPKTTEYMRAMLQYPTVKTTIEQLE